jgi:hypothetical protein
MSVVTEKSVQSWSIRLSFDDYNEERNYWFTSERFALPATVTTPELASEWAEAHYGVGQRNSAVAYQLFSKTVTTETVTTETEDGLARIKEVVTTEKVEHAPVFREGAEYKKNVLDPQKAWEQARFDSGEQALDHAWQDESTENIARKARGEEQVYTAEKAWYEFKGYAPLDRHLPKPEQAAKGLLARLFQS